jgi:hypothetical protein
MAFSCGVTGDVNNSGMKSIGKNTISGSPVKVVQHEDAFYQLLVIIPIALATWAVISFISEFAKRENFTDNLKAINTQGNK